METAAIDRRCAVILVRIVFQAKFGKAGELAAGMKSMGQGAGANITRARNVKILTGSERDVRHGGSGDGV
jgi:hypothetical protein